MRGAALLAVLVPVLACAPAHERIEDRPRVRSGAEGPTVVGHVSADGRVVADTLAGARQDTARAERETVYAGVVTPAPIPALAGGATPLAPETGPWRVQAYAAREEAPARALAGRLEAEMRAPARVERDGGWYRVRLGGYASRGEAEALRRRLVGRGYADAFVVRAP